MPTTTNGYPYPTPAEPVAGGAAAIQALAEAIDTKTPLKTDAVYVLDHSTTLLDYVNSGGWTTLYSKAVPAGLMSTNRLVRCTILGDYLNNSGSAQTLTLGITGLWGDATIPIPAAASRRPFRLTFEIANLGSATAQVLAGTLQLGDPAPGTLAGIGDANSSLITAVFGGTGALATASAWTVGVDVLHGAANANLSLRKRYALLELA